MIRPVAAIGIVVLFAGGVFPQSTDPSPKFEAADVHISPPATVRFMRGGVLHGTRYELKNASIVDLISEAYGLDADKILGGPGWLEMDRFDVIAKAPLNSSPENLKLMLRSVLADRFKLALRQENRPLPAYALTAGKHQGLKEADQSGEPGCRISIQQPAGGPQPDGPGPGPLMLVSTCHNVSMARFAEELKDMPLQAQTSRPVIDQTGLKGNWDFSFKYSLAQRLANGGETITLLEAVDKLGLKLEPITTPLPVIVVDGLNRKPTENPPEVAKAFPSPPTEFDVAEIKPADPSTPGGGVIMLNGAVMVAAREGGGGGRGRAPAIQNGRVNLQGYPLKTLILLAWDVSNTDMLLGVPKFAETDRYDVIGKVPAGFADAFTDIDSIKPLLRTLLTDRFKITSHTETRPMPGFVLSAAKPKLAKADPAGRTKWINGPGPDGKDPRIANPALSRLVTCQNMTMAQFAELLPNIAGGYVRTAVVDETGLDGAWDFTLNFSPAGAVNGGGGRGGDMMAPAASGNAAAEPTGGLSLYDALTKQLGLKLETQKRPMPVTVIDHVEPKPAEN